MAKGDPLKTRPVILGITARKLAVDLRQKVRRSHSDDSDDYSIPNADCIISQIGIQNSLGKMGINHQILIELGWNGRTCIGSGSVKKAIDELRRSSSSKLRSCGKVIPASRRKANPSCYRCVSCQEKHDEEKSKR
jgi:hypothetical protein